jgi:plasmid replication initiation protein
MPTLNKDHIISKRNLLNEIRANNMSLTELRFLSIYLSRINPAKPEETRAVRFPLDDFRAIMGLGSRLKINHMHSTTDSLLGKVVKVPNEESARGYKSFQLFKRCTVSVDKSGEWFVEIDAHDEALPLMFNFKDRYFKYKLFNALQLKSSNQLRMYEILKQYETVGVRVLSVEDLRGLLGIEKKEYPRYNDFKKWVLDACQQALKENTDIKFTYEPHGKKGAGGKITALKFIIEKNESYIDQLTLDIFIEKQRIATEADHKDDSDYVFNPYYQRIELLSSACNEEFDTEDIKLLWGLIQDHEPRLSTDDIACHDYLERRYQYLNSRAKRKPIENRFGYLKSLIGKDI